MSAKLTSMSKTSKRTGLNHPETNLNDFVCVVESIDFSFEQPKTVRFSVLAPCSPFRGIVQHLGVFNLLRAKSRGRQVTQGNETPSAPSTTFGRHACGLGLRLHRSPSTTNSSFNMSGDQFGHRNFIPESTKLRRRPPVDANTLASPGANMALPPQDQRRFPSWRRSWAPGELILTKETGKTCEFLAALSRFFLSLSGSLSQLFSG